MKKLIMLAAMAVAIASCGGKEEKKEKFEIKRTTAPTQEKKETVEVPVDMNNKGVGPITSLKFDSEVDETLAKEGETLYNQKCTICHMADKKLIGPALKGIYDRRSPEWVMNMMLDPMKMLKEDTIAKALQKANNNAIMTDQGLSEEQARALAEYLRTL